MTRHLDPLPDRLMAAAELAREAGGLALARLLDEAAGEIAAAGVPVIINPLSDRPESFQVLGATMENAARLQAAGVTLAIESQGGAHRVRELRYNVGNAIANGMPYQAGLAGGRRGAGWTCGANSTTRLRPLCLAR